MFCFPVFLGALLVAGVLISLNASIWEATAVPDGHYHLSFIEGDTWHHILVGEDILRTHTWPTKDSYTFTAAGNESLAFEWLGQVTLALVYRTAGLRGLALALTALASALLLLLYRYATLRCGNPEAAFLSCALLLPLASAFFTLRPQLLGFIFMAVTLIVLGRYRQGHEKALWLLPILFALWVNTHGSFVLGLMVLGVYGVSGLAGFQLGGLKAERWTSQQRRQLALVFLLSLLALMLTPYGPRVVGFTLHVILHAPLGMSAIMEYQPLGAFSDLMKFYVVLLILFLLGLVTLRPVYRLEEMMLLLASVYGACVHARLLLFFVLVFAPLLASLLATWVVQRDQPRERWALNAALTAFIAVALVALFPSRRRLETAVDCAFPRGAVSYLEQHPIRGRLFNEDFWGAYIRWSLGRDQQIFIDGRSQLFEDAGVLSDYVEIMQTGRDTPALLNKYGIEACLIERSSALTTLLAASRGWQQVYADNVSALFVHGNPGTTKTGQ